MSPEVVSADDLEQTDAPRQSITISIDARAPEIGPAALLALVAYPEGDQTDARGTFLMALRANFYDFLARDPERRMDARLIEPLLFASPRKFLERSLKKGHTQLKHRVIAARMAATIIHENAAAVPLSVNAVAQRVVNAGLADSDANVKSRHWSPSKPVLHLALAIRDTVIQRHGIAGDYPYAGLLDAPDWIEGALVAAETLREFIISSPLFPGITDSEMVRVVAS